MHTTVALNRGDLPTVDTLRIEETGEPFLVLRWEPKFSLILGGRSMDAVRAARHTAMALIEAADAIADAIEAEQKAAEVMS